MDHEYYTYDELIKGINVITRKITLSNWRPDVVIGILRGGLIPATHLSHWFSCPLKSFEYPDCLKNSFLKKTLKKNKNILLVDDICDSGHTLVQVSEFLDENVSSRTKIRTTVLHYNIGQDIFAVDYYHKEINNVEESRWVIYPWELD